MGLTRKFAKAMTIPSFDRFILPLIRALQEEQTRAFLWAPVCLGIGIGLYFLWPYEPEIIVSFYVLVAFGFFLILSGGAIATRAMFLVALGFVIATGASLFYGTPMLDWPTHAITISANIAEVEQHKSGRRLLLEKVKLEGLPDYRKPRRIRLVMPRRLDKQAPEIKPGQHLQAVAKLLPMSEPMVPGGFDFRRNAFFKGIGATGYLMGRVQVTDANSEKENESIHIWFARIRQKIQTEVKKTLVGENAGLAIILLTGDQTSLSPETAEAMRSIGLAHLLAIAGLHIGLVAGIIFFLTRALMALFPFLALRYPIKKWAAFLAFLAIIFYTLLVGAPVPTRRALIMMGTVLLAVMLDRISLSQRTVALAAFIILLIWPQMLLHPAFQLSFAAVLGIITVHDWIRSHGWRLFPGREGLAWNILRHVLELAGASVVATLATLPFCIYHFQEAEVYSVLANTLAIPLTAFWLMPCCIFVLLLMPLGLMEWPLRILGYGTNILVKLSYKISELPGAHYNPPPMPFWLFIIIIGGGLIFCFMRGKRRWIGLGVMISGILLSFSQPRPDIFISPDGKQIGWLRRDPDELLVVSYDKPDSFMANFWGERLGIKEDRIRFIDEEDFPPLFCNAERCLWKKEGFSMAWLFEADALKTECTAGHAILINPGGYEVCSESTSLMLTKKDFSQHGAHAVYVFDKDFKVVYSREGRAMRPWSTGWRPKEYRKG